MGSSQLDAIARSLRGDKSRNGKDREISRLQKALNAERDARLDLEARLAASEAARVEAETERDRWRKRCDELNDTLIIKAGSAEKAEAALAEARNGALQEAADRADTEKRIYHSGESDFDHGAYMASENIKTAILALTTTAPGDGT